MSNIRLTQRLIDALKPRKKTFDLRDTELKGFGVRVRCSGIKRYFVQSQHEEIRTWRMLGDASGMSLEEARCHARSVLASLHNGEEIIVVNERRDAVRGGRGETVRGLREALEGQHQKGQS